MGNVPMPAWWDNSQEGSVPTPGGVLDGLPSPDTGSSLHLLMEPKDIATIDGLPATVSEGASLGKPVVLPEAPEVCSPSGTAPSPEEYARRGEMAGQIFLNPADPDGNTALAGPIYLAQDMLRFKRGGLLDAQVLYGGSTPYANYAFGDYNAAAGMSLPGTLDLANTYGKHASHYGENVPMDKVYKSIPVKNVQNITKGYNDYKNGTLCRKP